MPTWRCGDRPCLRGFETVPGPALTLFRRPPRALAAPEIEPLSGDALRLPLESLIAAGDVPGGLRWRASSSDDSVATARVVGGRSGAGTELRRRRNGEDHAGRHRRGRSPGDAALRGARGVPLAVRTRRAAGAASLGNARRGSRPKRANGCALDGECRARGRLKPLANATSWQKAALVVAPLEDRGEQAPPRGRFSLPSARTPALLAVALRVPRASGPAPTS